MEKVSIVVPCYNEQEVILETYNRLNEIANKFESYELIFVNDGSKDNTLGILKEIAGGNNNVKIVNFARNFGHQIAISAGLDFATGNYISFIDADLQDPPELIPQMIQLMKKESCNVVYGTRSKRKGETIFKKLTAKIYYRVLKGFSDIEIPVDTGDFRVIDKKVGDVLRSLTEKDRFVRGLVSWSGFKQMAIEFERQERFAGETKYTLKKMIKLSLDGILSFSTKPLNLSSNIGVIMGILSVAILILSIIFKLCNIPNIAILLAILIMGSINLVCLGILGEYIGRIYNEVKGRPLYIVNDLINFDN